MDPVGYASQKLQQDPPLQNEKTYCLGFLLLNPQYIFPMEMIYY